MELNGDKTEVHLAITGSLTAPELDALLRQLALVRADMAPAVVATRDDLEAAGTQVLIEDKPALVIRARRGGGFRMWLRHRGFGWCGYQIDDLTANTLADYIASFRVVGEDRPNLVAHSVTNRH